MADLGDFVKNRKYGYLGEVVNKTKDGWCMVLLRANDRRPLDGFAEEHEKHLIVLEKGKNG